MAFVFWGWVRKAARLLRYVGYLLLLVPIAGAAFLATHPVFNTIMSIALVGTAHAWEGEFSKKHLLLSGGPIMPPIAIFILLVVFYGLGYLENGSIVDRKWRTIGGAASGTLLAAVVLFFVWIVVTL